MKNLTLAILLFTTLATSPIKSEVLHNSINVDLIINNIMESSDLQEQSKLTYKTRICSAITGALAAYAVHAMNYKVQQPENALVSLLTGFIVYQFVMAYQKPDLTALLIGNDNQKLLNAIVGSNGEKSLKDNLNTYFANKTSKDLIFETTDKLLYSIQQRLETILFALNYQKNYKDSKFTSLKKHVSQLIAQVEFARKKIQTPSFS